MSYIDAGWAIGLGVVFAYAVFLIAWRRRLTRAVARADAAPVPAAAPPASEPQVGATP